ncbi:ABC transporter permease [Bifidobacterium sp. A11]|uniref:ABC transporter permease n=1 Tax=Bifidobacterium sp. A11 TaxID=1394176 RepID=UPI000423A61D|nr:ABC transporter permease [Bifidobacterium sp. A11]
MVETLFSGLIHGGVYALAAVGMSLVFGVTNVANFAQGSLVAVGMMTAWWVGSSLGWGLVPTILAVVLVTGLVGLITNLLVITPLEGRQPIASLLGTVGLGQVLDNGMQLIFGSQTRPFPQLLPTHNLHALGISFGTSDLVMGLVALASMAALWAFLTYGRTGQAIRATSQDSQAALQMGVPVTSIRTIAFVIGSVLAGIAGIFIGLFKTNINPMDGNAIGMTAFVAAAIGGLGSIPGAIIGGLVLGLAEAVGVGLFGDGVHDLITFGTLLLVLILKPSGFLGRKADMGKEPMTGTLPEAARPIRLPLWANLGLAAAALATPFIFSDHLAGIGTQVAIYAIAAVGLTLISGSAGQTILGLAGPVAVGAYASALLTMRLHWPFTLSLLGAAVIAALAASLLTFPVWKLSGHYVAIATIGVGAVMVAIIRIWEPLTRGSLGLQGIPLPTFLGKPLYTQQMQYLLDLIVLLLVLAVISRIRSSHLGHVFEAIGEDGQAAWSLGIRTGAYKALAYALACGSAGIAGALLAHQYTYIDPTLFNPTMSTLILTIIVLGGMKSPTGAVIGSLILVGAPELLRILPEVRIMAYGLVLIIFIICRPQGLFSTKRRA